MGEEQLYRNLATPEEIARRERKRRVRKLGDGFVLLGVEARKARMWAEFLDEFSDGRMRESTDIGSRVEVIITIRDESLFFQFNKDAFAVVKDYKRGLTSIRHSQPLEKLEMRNDDGTSLIFKLKDGSCVGVKNNGSRIKICSAPSENLIWLDLSGT